ncbi:MAG: hypothetical protein ACLSHX_14700 [Suilimivivens sp.]
MGACYSINRDSNLGLTTDIFGPDAPKTAEPLLYILWVLLLAPFLSVSWLVS